MRRHAVTLRRQIGVSPRDDRARSYLPSFAVASVNNGGSRYLVCAVALSILGDETEKRLNDHSCWPDRVDLQ